MLDNKWFFLAGAEDSFRGTAVASLLERYLPVPAGEAGFHSCVAARAGHPVGESG